jgi:hypothetical protein
MAFSSSSFFVGVGTVVAAIAVGFAGGAMITTSTVQPQNRLERVTTGAAPPSTASSSKASEQANMTAPPAQQSPPQVPATTPSPQVVATVPSAPVADSQTVQQPQPAAPVAAKVDTKTEAAANVQQPPTAPPQTAKSEDAAPARNERASARPAELNKEAARPLEANREPSHKRGDERKFVERKRRQDLDEATNVVRQMPRDGAIDRVVQEDDAPRIIDGPPRRFGLFGNNEDSPRVVNEPPPRFGLFGN